MQFMLHVRPSVLNNQLVIYTTTTRRVYINTFFATPNTDEGNTKAAEE